MSDPASPFERFSEADRLLAALLERPEAEREASLAELHSEDPELGTEVAELLRLAEEKDALLVEGGALAGELGEAFAEESAVSEPTASWIDTGPRIGRYEIRGALGAGGMGEVFRAFDPRLRREVAIKVIGRRVEDQPDTMRRFEREARAASALNHPNIVTVHDIGEHEGSPFIVMELVDGESLRALLTRPLSVERILGLSVQIAAGLAAAHESGVVHRDLKPENIVVDRRETPRILDFGIARLSSAPAESGATESSTLTLAPAGVLEGTVGYMAPEALRGESVDQRADQFAFGAILYEMATGERVFRRDTVAESVAATIYEEPPALLERRSDLPASLAAIIECCLDKDPARRYESSAELYQALVALQAHPQAERRAPVGLPTPATPIVGRAAELEALQGLLLEPTVRLVTLTGVGGSGKSRLAIEAARGLAEQFPGGVGFVPLAAIDDRELVVPAIARALGGVESAGGELLSDLIRTLAAAEGPILLVLDNFEQVVDAAPTIGKLVEACAGLTVLVTSRELLHLSAERDFPVRPLGLPPTGPLQPLEELARTPAVALFVERARLADPDFQLRPDNAPPVAELCRRLDGLPLALELAAARLRMMSPQALLQRLESRLGILTGGPRDLPERQRTLRAAIESSYDLLDDADRLAFRRLAVFVGGFTLEAAEAVVDPFGHLERGAVEAVESLLDQSLLVRESVAGGEPRFSMLETVREYALERLQADENAAALKKAHAAYFMVLAEEAEAASSGRGSPQWLARFESEQGNFRAALLWARSEEEGEWGLRLANGLFHFWERGEGLSEGRRHLAALLELPATQPVTELRARGLFRAGALAALQRDFAASRAYYEEGLAAYRALGNRWGEAAMLNAIGIVLTDFEQYAEAQAYFEECLELWQELGESDGAARSLANLAYVLRQLQEHEKARLLYRDAAAMFRRLGDEMSAAFEASHEADVARDQGDPEAESLYREALETFRELQEPWGVGSVLVDLAELATQAGQYDDSLEHYREALAIFHRLGHLRGIARVLEGWALVEARRREHESAILLAGAAAALRQHVGVSFGKDLERQKDLEASLAEARRELEEKEASSLWQRGQETPPSRLVTDLLEAG